MMKPLLVLAVLFAVGGAGAEETPEPELYFENTGEYQIKFWEEPECPEGWGRVVVNMPPEYDYETVTIDCGLVVEPTDD